MEMRQRRRGKERLPDDQYYSNSVGKFYAASCFLDNRVNMKSESKKDKNPSDTDLNTNYSQSFDTFSYFNSKQNQPTDNHYKYLDREKKPVLAKSKAKLKNGNRKIEKSITKIDY